MEHPISQAFIPCSMPPSSNPFQTPQPLFKALGLSSPPPSPAPAADGPAMSSPSPPPPPSDPPRPLPLLKQNSWSPDFYREEVWLKRKGRANRRSKSVTDEDLDELKACFELGFGFDSPDLDPRLSHAFPAYGLYHAVNSQFKHNTDSVSVSKSSSSSLLASDPDLPSPVGSPLTMFSPGEDPKRMKTRLKQWAQVVACSVRHSCT